MFVNGYDSGDNAQINNNIANKDKIPSNFNTDKAPSVSNKISKINKGQTTGKIEFNASKSIETESTQKIKERVTLLAIEEAKRQRTSSPITTHAIVAQSQLHQAMRQAKIFASGRDVLTPQGTSANQVYPLSTLIKDSDENKETIEKNKLKSSSPEKVEVEAFFKVGSGGEQAAGIMERMMWDFAVMMNLENQFVATGKTEILYAQHLSDADALEHGEIDYPTKHVWTSGGLLAPAKDESKSLKGGIQPAQHGKVLKEWKGLDATIQPKLSKLEYNHANLACMAFGMWDTHSKNIFVTDNGKIKFFDNTRSMPNSNGFIDRGGYLVSAYRSSLLDLPEASQPFSTEEKIQIKEKIHAFSVKIKNLEKFIASKQVQQQINSLPYGWMNAEASIEAMKARINLMQQAIESDEVANMLELALHAIPEYKFSIALETINRFALEASNFTGKALHEKVVNDLHGYIGYTHVDKLFEFAIKLGINIKQLREFCNQPSVSIKEIIQQTHSSLFSSSNIKEKIFDLEENLKDLKSTDKEYYNKLNLIDNKIDELKQKNKDLANQLNDINMPFNTRDAIASQITINKELIDNKENKIIDLEEKLDQIQLDIEITNKNLQQMEYALDDLIVEGKMLLKELYDKASIDYKDLSRDKCELLKNVYK